MTRDTPPGNKFLESGCFDRLLGGRCMHCGDDSGNRPMDCGRCLASVESGWLTALYTLIQQGKAVVSPLCTPFRDPYCFVHQTFLTEATLQGAGPLLVLRNMPGDERRWCVKIRTVSTWGRARSHMVHGAIEILKSAVVGRTAGNCWPGTRAAANTLCRGRDGTGYSGADGRVPGVGLSAGYEGLPRRAFH